MKNLEMEASLKEQNQRNDKEKMERLEKERLQKEEEKAIQLQKDLERQRAVRKAAEEAEAAVSLVHREVTVDRVEEELAVVVGAFDSDANDNREKFDSQHVSMED